MEAGEIGAADAAALVGAAQGGVAVARMGGRALTRATSFVDDFAVNVSPLSEMQIAQARAVKFSRRGGYNPKTAAASAFGRKMHADRPGHLPDQFRQLHPESIFKFRPVGQDIEWLGGKHPSGYPGSTLDMAIGRQLRRLQTRHGGRTSNLPCGSTTKVGRANAHGSLRPSDRKASMNSILFPEIQLVLRDDWEIAEEESGLLTIVRPDGVGALQVSTATYEAGALPQITLGQLRSMMSAVATSENLTDPFDVVEEEGHPAIVAASYHASTNFVRAWYVSDGVNAAFVTYVCEGADGFEELPDCEAMVRSIVFV
jgi:hypothetical protein